MGAWATGPFAHDTAGDFVRDLDTPPLAQRAGALTAV
jgi:hypothetical protein